MLLDPERLQEWAVHDISAHLRTCGVSEACIQALQEAKVDGAFITSPNLPQRLRALAIPDPLASADLLLPLFLSLTGSKSELILHFHIF